MLLFPFFFVFSVGFYEENHSQNAYINKNREYPFGSVVFATEFVNVMAIEVYHVFQRVSFRRRQVVGVAEMSTGKNDKEIEEKQQAASSAGKKS